MEVCIAKSVNFSSISCKVEGRSTPSNMGCSCRITPLRIFVQGLAQIHHVEPSFLRLPSSSVSSTLFRTRFAASRQTRSFHNTIALRSEEANAAKTIPSERPRESSPSSSDASPVQTEKSGGKDPVKDSFQRSDEKPRRAKPDFQSPRNNKSKFASNRFSSDRWSSEKFSKDKKFGNDRGRSQGDYGNKPHDKSSFKRFSKPYDKKPFSQPYSKPYDKKPFSQPFSKPYDKKSFSKPYDKTPSSGEIDAPKPEVPNWKAQKAALKEKFPDGWNPRKRLSPDALAGIRALNAQFPEVYTTEALAKKFEVSPENIRRILRSKWTPSVDEEQDRQERWFRRGKNVWESQAALGKKPPRKWRQEGVARDPSYHEWRSGATKKNQEFESQEKDTHRSAWQKRNQGGSSSSV